MGPIYTTHKSNFVKFVGSSYSSQKAGLSPKEEGRDKILIKITDEIGDDMAEICRLLLKMVFTGHVVAKN